MISPPSLEAGHTGVHGKHRKWQGFHTVAAAFIVFGAVLAAFAGITEGPDKGVLYGEWIAIWAFAASWLVKGAEWETLFGRRAASVVAGADRPPESSTIPLG